MHEDDDKAMVSFSWIVAGASNMELHAFQEGDTPTEPTISVIMSGTGSWTFKFKKIKGSGRIQVTKGCDYNPIDLIETLYHHIMKLPQTSNKPNNLKPQPSIDLDPDGSFADIIGFGDEWA